MIKITEGIKDDLKKVSIIQLPWMNTSWFMNSAGTPQ